MNQKQKHDVKRNMLVIKHAEITTNVSKTCRYFGISWQNFVHYISRSYFSTIPVKVMRQDKCMLSVWGVSGAVHVSCHRIRLPFLRRQQY